MILPIGAAISLSLMLLFLFLASKAYYQISSTLRANGVQTREDYYSVSRVFRTIDLYRELVAKKQISDRPIRQFWISLVLGFGALLFLGYFLASLQQK